MKKFIWFIIILCLCIVGFIQQSQIADLKSQLAGCEARQRSQVLVLMEFNHTLTEIQRKQYIEKTLINDHSGEIEKLNEKLCH